MKIKGRNFPSHKNLHLPPLQAYTEMFLFLVLVRLIKSCVALYENSAGRKRRLIEKEAKKNIELYLQLSSLAFVAWLTRRMICHRTLIAWWLGWRE